MNYVMVFIPVVSETFSNSFLKKPVAWNAITRLHANALQAVEGI